MEPMSGQRTATPLQAPFDRGGRWAVVLGAVVLAALPVLLALALPRTAAGVAPGTAPYLSTPVGVPLVSIQAVVPAGAGLGASDVLVPVGQQGHATAMVSDLNAAGRAGRADGRDVQAVAVLLVVGAGTAALVGAYVLRRKARDERP